MESPSISLLQIITLALIQGVTEFLPISSSAHLILPQALTDWPDQGLAFDVAVHLGTLVAVVAYFRRDLAAFMGSGAALVGRREWDGELGLLFKLGVATVPVAIAGLLFRVEIETHLRTTTIIAATTITFGVVLWWADWRRGGDDAPTTPSYAQAMLIGAAQALALVPGVSRAGITIATALALGLGRAGAARFSFLLAIPAIIGAALLTGVDAGGAPMPWIDLGIGFVVAAASAFASIAVFIGLINRTGMAPYAIYRVGLGIALLLLC